MAKEEIKHHFVAAGRQNKTTIDDIQKTDELIVYVALKYPQYTIAELRDMPMRIVNLMALQAKKDEAQFLLTLNTLINGPNSKDKSHRSYKNAVEGLAKIIESGKKKKDDEKSIEDKNAELLKMVGGIK